jgi:hypothetical protein
MLVLIMKEFLDSQSYQRKTALMMMVIMMNDDDDDDDVTFNFFKTSMSLSKCHNSLSFHLHEIVSPSSSALSITSLTLRLLHLHPLVGFGKTETALMMMVMMMNDDDNDDDDDDDDMMVMMMVMMMMMMMTTTMTMMMMMILQNIREPFKLSQLSLLSSSSDCCLLA